MSGRFTPPSPKAVARIRAKANRALSKEEFLGYVESPKSNEERENNRALIAWFRRRYPTPRERLAYARRMYAEWLKAMPPSE
jgi:hypothetical protein